MDHHFSLEPISQENQHGLTHGNMNNFFSCFEKYSWQNFKRKFLDQCDKKPSFPVTIGDLL